VTDPAQPAASNGGYRFTPAEIQQQLIQCTDLLAVRTGVRARNQANFLHNWYDTLISARARYLEQENITEAQWNILAQDGQPEEFSR
jgi:hypothetical protein